MADPMMTSHDSERLRSWSQYLQGLLFWKRLELETWLQWGTYSKWHAWYWMVMWSITSR